MRYAAAMSIQFLRHSSCILRLNLGVHNKQSRNGSWPIYNSRYRKHPLLLSMCRTLTTRNPCAARTGVTTPQMGGSWLTLGRSSSPLFAIYSWPARWWPLAWRAFRSRGRWRCAWLKSSSRGRSQASSNWVCRRRVCWLGGKRWRRRVRIQGTSKVRSARTALQNSWRWCRMSLWSGRELWCRCYCGD